MSGFSYGERIRLLRERKLSQTEEKIVREGGLNEDDYGRVVPPEDFAWEIIPNNPDGSFYGYEGWSENFYALMAKHPVYVDPLDAFSGRWMFFLSRMKGPVWNPEFPYDHLKPEQEAYSIIPGIGGDAHFATDYRLGLELGWDGVTRKLEHYKALHGEKHTAFYDAELRTVEAIQLWIRRTNDRIAEMISVEQNETLRENLREMHRVNERVTGGAPRTLREACQWICWYNMAKRTYNRDGAGCQLDRLLMPYYERDVASRILDDDTARFYLACLLLNDTHYYQLAGPGEDGADLTNRLSYLILEAADLINISCNLTIRVHDGLDPVFFEKAVGYLFRNKNGWPRFSGDKALVEGFMRSGYPAELARQRIAVGCNWMSLPGLEYTLNDLVKINVAKVFEVAFAEMMCDTEQSTIRLWELFGAHLGRAVHVTGRGMDFHLRHQVKNEPELVLNLLSHGPVEKGLDVTEGGAEYLNLAIDGAGIAVVADSFAALEQRIERERRVTWAEVWNAVQTNFEGAEYLRRMLGKSSRYGGDDGGPGGLWGEKVSRLFTEEVRRLNGAYPGRNFIPGWFSWANTIDLGRAVGATPNGRRSGEPINHGANPLPGFRVDGAVTALANTIARIQPAYGNTAPIQLELDPGIADSEEAEKKIADLIRVMFEQGATLLNINIVDRDKILAAHRDPSKFPDLVVRVTGFTAYFSMLSAEFRQLVVDRMIAKG